MVSDELAPLEAHVEAQVKHLTAVAGVVRELQAVEKLYTDGYVALPLDLPADTKAALEGLPQLQRVSDGFSKFVRKSSAIKAAVAVDLSEKVIAPLEAFTAEHVEKTQHLLSELYELLQKEKAFDVAYQNLLETCERDHNAGPAANSELVEAEAQLHRAHMEQLLRKRDAERLAIQQWITALHFAGQRYEAHVRNVLQLTIAVYDRMVVAMTKLADDYQELGRGDNEVTATLKPNSDNNCRTVSEDNWESILTEYECHVTITSWMSELFKHLVPAEHKFAKCMQKAIKLDKALCKAFGGVGFSAHFAGFVQFHGLLMNISNPIMRTLKFSKERQERMRNELMKSLEETQALVSGAQSRVSARLAKDKVEEETPVRCDSMTSSETSDDNNQEDPKASDPVPQQDTTLAGCSPGQIELERLERKLALQRQEMAQVLEQTSYLSVKTLELMVQDHVKHVSNALATLKVTMHAESPETKRSKSDETAQPWSHITERLAITVSDQPAVGSEDDQTPGSSNANENTRAATHEFRRTSRAHEINEPRSVQVALSAAQTAVGVAAWATTMLFKAARAQVPSSCEERVALVAIMAMILALAGICVRSSQLQSSWINLTHSQHSNCDDIVQAVKLALEQCTQVNAVN